MRTTKPAAPDRADLLAGMERTWPSTPAPCTALSARLGAVGLEASEQEAAMWALLDDAPSPEHVTGLDLRPVTTPEGLADHASVVAANRDPPAATVRRFFTRAAESALADDCPARYLVGYVDAASSSSTPSEAPHAAGGRQRPAPRGRRRVRWRVRWRVR
ncbi:hypothetical protein [Kitasatospora sp. NPDC059827]|uniref:hypothetical protein n=1 Tax=Kitasatospora sp. NPDC059827 TaxID=3346964 RepID=UPI0036520A16